MLTQRQSNKVHTKDRKNRDGDWICIKCSNYNYAFRDHCNRCRFQDKRQNQRMMNAIGKENYGEHSFPSVLFLTLQQSKDSREVLRQSSPNQKINYIEKIMYPTDKDYRQQQMIDDIDSIMADNIWISNLIKD